jgi:hypothetical protein
MSATKTAVTSPSQSSSSSVIHVNTPISTPKPSSQNLPPSPDTDTVELPNAASNHPLNSSSMSDSTLSDNGQGQSTGDETLQSLFIIFGGAIAFLIAVIIIIVAISLGVCLKIKSSRANKESVGTLTANHRMAFPAQKPVYRVESEMELNEAYVTSGYGYR